MFCIRPTNQGRKVIAWFVAMPQDIGGQGLFLLFGTKFSGVAMELLSRVVFLDTSVYQGKNFQFQSHILKSLKDLVHSGELRLLISDITKSEIKLHISQKAKSAASVVKKLKKEAMILRNLSHLPIGGIFEDISSAQIEGQLFSDFENFLESENVESVAIDVVLPSKVFNSYFSMLPPFAPGEKSKEFSDAFVLEALDHWANANGTIVHVVSTDGDMQRFVETRPMLSYSESINEFVEAVNYSVSLEPSTFAQVALERLMAKILDRARTETERLEPLVGDFFEFCDKEEFSISEISVKEFSLIGVDEGLVEYLFEFLVDVKVLQLYDEYDNELTADDDLFFEPKPKRRTASYQGEVMASVEIDISERIVSKTFISKYVDFGGVLILENAKDVVVTDV